MPRGRSLMFFSMGVVALGVAAAVPALVIGRASSTVGPLPQEALPIIADARYAMGLDMSRFLKSEFRRRFAPASSTGPDTLRDLEAKTGLNPERDIDQIYAAGGAPGDNRGVALIQGRFDRDKIAHTIETEQKGVTWERHGATTVYVFSAASKSPGALAFLDQRTIVLGTQQAVEAVVARSGQKTEPGASSLQALLTRVKPGSTFWIIGDQTVLSSLPKTLPGGGPGGAALAFPALKSVIITGDLDPVVSLSIVGDTADPAAAKNMADVVRGLIGLLTLQGGQKPGFAKLAEAFTIDTEQTLVRVNAQIPYEVLDSLQSKATSAPPPPPPPPSGH